MKNSMGRPIIDVRPMGSCRKPQVSLGVVQEEEDVEFDILGYLTTEISGISLIS